MPNGLMGIEDVRNDPDSALKIATLLYELYADQYGLKLESITVTDRKAEESA